MNGGRWKLDDGWREGKAAADAHTAIAIERRGFRSYRYLHELFLSFCQYISALNFHAICRCFGVWRYVLHVSFSSSHVRAHVFLFLLCSSKKHAHVFWPRERTKTRVGRDWRALPMQRWWEPDFWTLEVRAA